MYDVVSYRLLLGTKKQWNEAKGGLRIKALAFYANLSRVVDR